MDQEHINRILELLVERAGEKNRALIMNAYELGKWRESHDKFMALLTSLERVTDEPCVMGHQKK